MKNVHYQTPELEVIEIEVEDVLCESIGGGVTAPNVPDGGSAW